MSNKFNLNRMLTTLAIIGIMAAVFMVFRDLKKPPIAQPVVTPSTSPYTSFISGSGIIEAKSENIALGTQVNGIADEILVIAGQRVKKGDVLFTLDMRQAKADLALKQAQLKEAKAALGQAKANLKQAKDNLSFIDKVNDPRAIAQEDLSTRENVVLVNEEALKNAEAAQDVAQRAVDAAQTLLDLYTIKAPMDAEILQINIHPGEFAAAANLSTPLMLIGAVQDYHVRVQIDENEAWRYKPDANATAILRGNTQFKTPLQYKYTEPYVIPKQSLTGDSTERVDTRVLEVVYGYDPSQFPAYIGQLVDVYIEAAEMPSSVEYGGPEVPHQ